MPEVIATLDELFVAVPVNKGLGSRHNLLLEFDLVACENATCLEICSSTCRK